MPNPPGHLKKKLDELYTHKYGKRRYNVLRNKTEYLQLQRTQSDLNRNNRKAITNAKSALARCQKFMKESEFSEQLVEAIEFLIKAEKDVFNNEEASVCHVELIDYTFDLLEHFKEFRKLLDLVQSRTIDIQEKVK